MEFRKMVAITLYTRQQKRHWYIEQFLDSVGEGEGGMIWENGIETCIISYVKWIASPGSMQDQDAWGWCTGMTQRDGMGRKVGEGMGRMIWENGIETCKISCVKWIASPGLMHNTGYSGLVHWDDPDGWDGEGGGRGVQDGEHMYSRGGCLLMYDKTNTI